MQKTIYEDYKYGMQDTSRVYVGCKYTFAEFLEAEEVMFKFRLLVQKYNVPEGERGDTPASQLYYLKHREFRVKRCGQKECRV